MGGEATEGLPRGGGDDGGGGHGGSDGVAGSGSWQAGRQASRRAGGASVLF